MSVRTARGGGDAVRRGKDIYAHAKGRFSMNLKNASTGTMITAQRVTSVVRTEISILAALLNLFIEKDLEKLIGGILIIGYGTLCY